MDNDLFKRSTPHHGVTHFQLFHSGCNKFYFCVRCCHTVFSVDSYQHQKSHTLFLLPKIEFIPTCLFVSTFPSVHVNSIIFVTYKCGKTVFLYGYLFFCQPINVYYQILLHEINIMQCHIMIKEKPHPQKNVGALPLETRHDYSLHFTEKIPF